MYAFYKQIGERIEEISHRFFQFIHWLNRSRDVQQLRLFTFYETWMWYSVGWRDRPMNNMLTLNWKTSKKTEQNKTERNENQQHGFHLTQRNYCQIFITYKTIIQTISIFKLFNGVFTRGGFFFGIV